MTLDDLKKEPLRRGDWLRHFVFGICQYQGKVRGNERGDINVKVTNLTIGGEHRSEARVRVKLEEVSRVQRATKMQGSRLILAVCLDCQLKIRATGSAFRLGVPLCFNEALQCPNLGKPMHIEWGEKGDGVLGMTPQEIAGAVNAERAAQAGNEPKPKEEKSSTAELEAYFAKRDKEKGYE